MSWFPQIGAGSVAQFPLRRTRTWRSIANQMESGERILLPDAAAGQIEWRLSFTELTDAETARINDFFASAEGVFRPFLFIDPLANLLGWSEDFSRPDWQAGLLQIVAGVTDPLGTQRAASVTNPGAGAQALAQTIAAPGDYVTCFSIWIRSDAEGTVMLSRDERTVTAAAGPVWRRFFVSDVGNAGSAQSTFSVILAAGQTVDIWGLQAEAQPYPSQYKPASAAAGIYAETYFGSDELRITSTGAGFSSCEIDLVSRI